MIKKLLSTLIFSFCMHLSVSAQGWPANYEGVMLQGFYWDSYSDSKWAKLEKQADELARYFDLIWVPNSGYCSGSNNMGYLPLYYFNQQSSFGSEETLRSMISTFKAKGLGTIADVVINHHANLSSWVDFPEETYKGKSYQFQSTDICRNDDGGACRTWADQNGVSISSNNDTGEDWSGARDLDHKSANVNTIIKAYLDFLLNDLGYSGFRYDMVKGYNAAYTADYNSTSKPSFSVGEYWDGSSAIKNWIDGTKVNGTPTSAAFDFQFRYRMRDAINQNNWTKLADNTNDAGGRPLIYDTDYRQYAVTFVENHDTEKRASDNQDPIKADTLAANAYLLAMPGTPCVFFKHWLTCKRDIKLMISARKLMGISNQSKYSEKASAQMYYATATEGKNGTLICVVGKTPTAFAAPSGYIKAASGKDYIYYIPEAMKSQWAQIEASIEEEQAVKENETFTPYDITINVANDNSWNRTNFYIWDSSNTQLNGGWPGKQVTETVTVNGRQWYRQTFRIKSEDYCINAVFSTGTGSPQTVDVTDITTDKYFVISTSAIQGKYTVNDVTSTTAITDVKSEAKGDNRIFTLTGQEVKTPVRGRIYIINGRKVRL